VFIRRSKKVVFAKQHKKSKALELHVQKPDKLRYLAGQYCFINVPSISRFEWHPFTLTSAPNESELKFHIAAVGDWTKKLYDLFPKGWQDRDKGEGEWGNTRKDLLKQLEQEFEDCPDAEARLQMSHLTESLVRHELKVYVDGPYGAPAQDFTKYKVAILVGSGIGVTPFAAVLRDLLHTYETWREVRDPLKGLQQMTEGKASFPTDIELEKVYFHWSTRTQQSLGWFTDVMEELCEADKSGMLEMHNYLTSAKMTDNKGMFDVLRRQSSKATGKDLMTGLDNTKVTTHLGTRLPVDDIFKRVKELHPNTKVGVFYCGTPLIRDLLETACAEHSGRAAYGETRFKLHAENF